jgi:hypothetical protein
MGERNREIYDLVKAGIDVDEIATEYGIGRQDVFNKVSHIERQIAAEALAEPEFSKLGGREQKALHRIGITRLEQVAGLTMEEFLKGEGNGPGGWDTVKTWMEFYAKEIARAKIRATREGSAPSLPLQPPSNPRPTPVVTLPYKKVEPPAVQQIKKAEAPAGDPLVCCPRCKFRWDPAS